VDWTYDTYALADGTANAIVRSGGDSWFFITADYAFGYAMQRDASNVINSDGGIVLGSVMVPLGCPTSPAISCKRKRQPQRLWDKATGVCSFLSTSAHEKAISPLSCGFSAIVLGHVICCVE
jgi:hypothetical protein